MNTDQLIARLVAIADERPNAPIGHVVEHELPELRAKAEAMPEQEPVAWMFQHEETGRTTFEYAPDDADAFEKNNPRWFRVCAVYRSPPDLAARVARLEGLLSRAQPSHSHSIKCRDSNSDENCLRCAIDAALAKGE